MDQCVLAVDLFEVDGTTTITAQGDIDADSVTTLRAVLDGLDLDRRVVIDMAGVGFMDSSGINTLLEHVRHMRPNGGSLRITRPSRQVARVVELTGLADLLFETNGD